MRLHDLGLSSSKGGSCGSCVGAVRLKPPSSRTRREEFLPVGKSSNNSSRVGVIGLVNSGQLCFWTTRDRYSFACRSKLGSFRPAAMPPPLNQRSLVVLLLLLVQLLSCLHAAAAAAVVTAKDCVKGQYFSAATNACEICPENFYAPVPGMTACMPCPAQASTLGVRGSETLINCACPRMFYLNEPLAVCASCPSPAHKYACPGGLTPLNFSTRCSQVLFAAAGGWWYDAERTAEWPAVYQRCGVVNACLDGCGTCREGHTGRLCQLCDSGWTRNFFSSTSACTTCPSVALRLVRHISSIIGLLILFAMGWFCTLKAAQQRLQNIPDEKRSTFVPAVKMLLFFYAVWGVYGLQGDITGKLWVEWETDGTDAADAGGSGAVVDPRSLSPYYFQQYVAAAREYLLFTLAGQQVDCWFGDTGVSPIYLFTCMALALPLAFLLLLFLIVNALFLYKKRRADPTAVAFLTSNNEQQQELLFVRQAKLHRNFIGLHLTAFFANFTLLTAFFWTPAAAVYFAAAFQCTPLATGENVQLLDPNVACGGPAYANATQAALPGLAIWAGGLPIGVALSVVYLRNVWNPSRVLLTFFIYIDFYKDSFYWWDSLRLMFTVALVLVAVHPFADGGPSLLAFLLALFAFLTAFAKPYAPQNFPKQRRLRCGFGSWKKRKELAEEKRRSVLHSEGCCSRICDVLAATAATIKFPRSNQGREVLLWTTLAFLFEFDAIRVSLADGKRRRALEYLIMTFFSLGQLLLMLWVLNEFFHFCLPFFKRCVSFFKREKQTTALISTAKVANEQEKGLELAEPKDVIRHKFSRNDESFFADAALLSAFPAEALAQLSTLLAYDNFAAADVTTAADWIFRQGHIEVQGQTLHVAFPRLLQMYSDITYDISSSADFVKEAQQLLRKVAIRLSIEPLFRRRLFAAQVLRENFCFQEKGRGFEKQISAALERAEPPNTWQTLLGAETAADLQMRWLRMHFHPDEEEATLRRALFTLVFPSALPVCRQEELRKKPPAPPQPTPNFFERMAELLLGREEVVEEPSVDRGDPLDVRM